MKYVWNGTEFVPKERSVNVAPYVQPDIEEYGGRSRFRDHLRKTNTVELGHSDIRGAQEQWQSKRTSFQDRIKNAEQQSVRPVDHVRVTEAPDYQKTRLNQELANRLDGRPVPDRKMLLKLTLETAKYLNRR